MRISGWAALVCSLALPAVAGAQEEREATPAPERGDRPDLARDLQNPASGLMRFEILVNVDLGLGPSDENRLNALLRPFLSIELFRNLNVVSWTILPILSLPPATPEGERTNGLGDTQQHFFLAPSRRGSFFWALGPVALVPTATESGLGSGQFGLGPTGTLAYEGDAFTAGVLANHVETFTGVEGHARVAETFVRLYASYTLPTSITFTLDSDSVIDRLAPAGDRYLGPIGATIARVIEIGDQLVNLMFGGRYYVARPDGGPEWNLRMSTTLLFTAAPVAL